MYEKPELIVVGTIGDVVLGGGDDWGEDGDVRLAAEGIVLGLDD